MARGSFFPRPLKIHALTVQSRHKQCIEKHFLRPAFYSAGFHNRAGLTGEAVACASVWLHRCGLCERLTVKLAGKIGGYGSDFPRRIPTLLISCCITC